MTTNRPRFSRRSLLRGGLAATLWGSVRSGEVLAQGAPESMLWVQVFATGGWDQMLFCDPKWGPRTDDDGGFHDLAQLRQVADIPYVDAYAASMPGIRPVETFFAAHGERLLVFNGLDFTTNNHDVGTRYAMSGSLLEGFPIFAAQVAAVDGPDRVMPLVDVSGYDECAGLVAPVRLDYVGVPKLTQLQDPNDPPMGLWVDGVGSTITADRYLPPGAYGALHRALDGRLGRLSTTQTLPRHQDALAAWARARAAVPGLAGLEVPIIGNDGAENAKALCTMGIRAWKAGLATSMTVACCGPNLDSHGRPDWEHLDELRQALEIAAHVAEMADAEGVPAVVVMSSDFGRTPVRERPGSGHWPVGSMMVLHNVLAAAKSSLPMGLVIGGTTGSPDTVEDISTVLEPRRIDPRTWAFDDAGIVPTPAHVFRALRRAAGIDGHTAISTFPIHVDGEDLDLG